MPTKIRYSEYTPILRNHIDLEIKKAILLTMTSAVVTCKAIHAKTAALRVMRRSMASAWYRAPNQTIQVRVLRA